MADHVLCAGCGSDLTDFHEDKEPRRPCPTCGSTARVFEASAVARLRLRSQAVGHAVSDEGSVTVPVSTVDVVVDVPAPTIQTSRVLAPHFDHLVQTYPPLTFGDHYVVQLVNPDTGLVEIVVHEDPAEAFRRLADPFADDI